MGPPRLSGIKQWKEPPDRGGLDQTLWQKMYKRVKGMAHKVAQPDQHRMLTDGAGDGCGKAVSKKSLWDVEWRSRMGDRTGPTFRLNQDHCDWMIQAGTGG